MLHPTTQQLIRKLYELTATGGLGWQPAEENTSRLETEGYVVEIAAEPPVYSSGFSLRARARAA